jgi:hypothetical protein
MYGDEDWLWVMVKGIWEWLKKPQKITVINADRIDNEYIGKETRDYRHVNSVLHFIMSALCNATEVSFISVQYESPYC